MTEKITLPDLLIQPARMLDLDTPDWNRILLAAHLMKLRGRLACDARACGIWDQLPPAVRTLLYNAEITTQATQRKIMWEVNRICRALHDLDVPLILLKGTAYQAKKRTAAQGRTAADVDILVKTVHLDRVENALLEAGYISQPLSDYDQRYYRQWSHELPPLLHPDRMVEVDIHHRIVQRTSRFALDSRALIAAAEPLTGNLYVLSPVDMLLHSMVHQFVDGTIKGSLRNLLEQHDMIGDFASDPAFWPRFVARAEALELMRPAFYSLRYCHHFLKTTVPAPVTAQLTRAAPPAPVLAVMDYMVHRVMVPFGTARSKAGDFLATHGLYLRAHWLRMPPGLLALHLFRKFLRRLFPSALDSG